MYTRVTKETSGPLPKDSILLVAFDTPLCRIVNASLGSVSTIYHALYDGMPAWFSRTEIKAPPLISRIGILLLPGPNAQTEEYRILFGPGCQHMLRAHAAGALLPPIQPITPQELIPPTAGAMTLDDAIAHAKEVCKEVCDEKPGCASEHQQLVEWLTELKAFRARG